MRLRVRYCTPAVLAKDFVFMLGFLSVIKKSLGQAVRRLMFRYLDHAGFRCTYLRPALRDLHVPDGWVLEGALGMLHGRRGGDVFFVQVGGFDGCSDDPLHQYIGQFKWRGLIVEPQRAAFSQLQKAHAGNSGILLECCAVGREPGELTLFRPSAPEGTLHASRFASSDPEHVRKHLRALGVNEPSLESECVPCLVPQDLLRRHQIARVDLLAVDAEGADAEILRAFDLAALLPRVILFEHANLEEDELRGILGHLKDLGYELNCAGLDVICTRDLRCTGGGGGARVDDNVRSML
jgi:FkbM family methyltransferase